MVDVSHNSDDGGARHPRLVRIVLTDKSDFNIRFRNALGRMTKLAHDELRRVGIDHIRDLVHGALLHQKLDDIDAALRHAVRKLLNGDRLRNDDLANDLIPGLLNAHGLELLALTLALQRRHRAFALLLIEGVVNGKLDPLTPHVRRGLGRLTQRFAATFRLAAALVVLHVSNGPTHARLTTYLACRLRDLCRRFNRSAASRGNLDLLRTPAHTRHMRWINGLRRTRPGGF